MHDDNKYEVDETGASVTENVDSVFGIKKELDLCLSEINSKCSFATFNVCPKVADPILDRKGIGPSAYLSL